MENLVNMKAIGIVVMMQSAMTFPEDLSKRFYSRIQYGNAVFRIFLFYTKQPSLIH